MRHHPAVLRKAPGWLGYLLVTDLRRLDRVIPLPKSHGY